MTRYYMGKEEVTVISKPSHNMWLVKLKGKKFLACTATLWTELRSSVDKK